MDTQNPYYKKTISYKFGNHNLEFMVSQDLFSSQVVDNGTQRLLRTLLFEKIDSFEKALDLGCGYGPIGIVLKKICPQSEVHMVDRDALALVYAKANVEFNNVNDKVSVYGSLGYDEVLGTDFDLIVSNIPAKVGEHVLTHIVKDARYHLKRNGKAIIVVIDAIDEYIHKELTTDESIVITYERSWPGHHVYHYRFRPESAQSSTSNKSAFERGQYNRGQSEFKFKNTKFSIKTTFHLPEFDQLSYETSLLLTALSSINSQSQDVLVFNPGQGYVPLAIAHAFHPTELYLVDRDLQALKVSQENLVNSGYPTENITLHHQVGIGVENKTFDLIAGILPEKQSMGVYNLYLAQAHEQLTPSGLFIVSSTSTVITRIEELLSKKSLFEVLKREKSKGKSVILLRKLD